MKSLTFCYSPCISLNHWWMNQSLKFCSNNTSNPHINQVFSQRNQWTFSLHSINNYWTTAFSHIEYIVNRTEKSLCSSLHLYIKPGSNLYNLIGWKLEKGTRWMLSIIPFLLKRVWNSLHLKRVTETMSWGFNRVCCTLPVLSHLKSRYQKCPIQASKPMSIVSSTVQVFYIHFQIKSSQWPKLIFFLCVYVFWSFYSGTCNFPG